MPICLRALKLNMTPYWRATAESYFGRVSKERIIEAVRESISGEAAQRIMGVKKQATASVAEQALRGRASCRRFS